MKISYICSWCGVEVEPNDDHTFTATQENTAHVFGCKGTFSHPGSGSCRRRFTDLGHHQVSEHHKSYDTLR